MRPETSATVRSASLPPLAAGLPLLGNVRELAADPRAFLFEQYQRLGPIFRVRALHQRFTVLAGPEATQFITRQGARHFSSHDFWSGMDEEFEAARSLISMDGPEHTRMRMAQKNGYSRTVIERRLPDVVEMVRQATQAWPVGEALPVHAVLQRLVTEQLGQLVARTSPEGYVDDLIFFVRMALQTRVTRLLPGVLRLLPRYRRAKARVHALGRAVLAAHETPPPEGQPANLIDALLALSREDPDFLPSSDLLISVLGPFIAGLDTVASTGAFVLHALLTQPALLERVTVEVDALFAEGPPAAARLRQLDVLHRTVLETLRMYPIAPAITRTVVEPFSFGGHEVARGEKVLIGTTVAHYLEKFYPNPTVFDIDRYLPERNEHRNPGAFAPYGAGPHICLGAGFAEVHLMILVAALLHTVRLAVDPPEYRLRIDPAPTPHPDKGFRMKVLAHRTTSAGVADPLLGGLQATQEPSR
ncbi:cytochrome P450 [Archangium sp.]|uniref:cytochrome P450 n=1 Tax=Archangium sp. TaxID=1872627 RepID=UPI002D224901|nr:cytochrome P450 [Archangium sp.]HYO52647.1 cytochrome P450 [Archangium sp.]